MQQQNPKPHNKPTDQPSAEAVMVLCTAPDQNCAHRLAEQALNARLAACVTLLPGAVSYYYWQGTLQQENEVQMLLKTDRQHQQALVECLKNQHPYQTPELLVLPVIHGDKEYLSWLHASLA